MRATTVAIVVPFILIAAWSDLFHDGSRGSPCGRNQHAFGKVILPDTGINAATEIQVSFIQHDPDLAGELSEVAIQRPWPSSIDPDPEPNPRVRLVAGDGRVIVDTLAGRSGRPTWWVLHWMRNAEVRNALYNAFATETLWLELWRANASGPGTRVRITVKEFGVNPPSVCL